MFGRDSDDNSDDDAVDVIVLVLDGVVSVVSVRLLIFAWRYSSSCLDGITVLITLSFSDETTYKTRNDQLKRTFVHFSNEQTHLVMKSL